LRIVVIGAWAPSLINFRAPLLRAMVARGHEVIGMAAQGTPEIIAQLAAIGVRFEEFHLERAGTDPASDLRTAIELARKLRRIAPELVFAYTIKPVIYGTLAAWIARVPHRAAMITGLGYSLTTARSTKQRAVAQLVRRLCKFALARCDAVLFQNPDDRAEYERLGLVPGHARVAIVRGSGVDLDHYASTPLPAGPPRFLFLGRLLHDKGITEFVECARRVRAVHPEVRFQILGWFDPNPESASRADVDGWVQSGVVEYLGESPDVRPTLAAAHVLVLPSYREGTPRSVLEAMSMGRAVITTDAPGCRETVVDGDSGLIVPARDAAALGDAARRLVESPALLERLAAAGHARAIELYDARKVAAAMLAALGVP
jgi:glycosyltransferase involved in cell wall biosynthesis